MTKGTLDFQNNKSKIFDLMGNMIDNPNKLNDSTWKRLVYVKIVVMAGIIVLLSINIYLMESKKRIIMEKTVV
ncbi:hypothetical protein COK34_06920 [Bacillus thuringiensis]|uniref:hypothetical protein n=1 Tax=Bacillus thuringiensis TaxID=1428 RepID=UPI000BF6D275|nr:hypothetical protein [Bacillus thuringiensis]PFD66886.1 hypothetical protein CN309_08440 [Bacillus thuringiensis]PFO46545.1 hypothetical protein COJ84_01395 [Bacillus thuringiensis]PFR56341.1 hypothetical protein COK34_06920 [Bacillus thuringiensis]